MSNSVNVHDLKTNYSKYLDKVISGQEVVLAKHGKAVAKIVPLLSSQKSIKPGLLKGKIWISEDFDEPLTFLTEAIKNKA